MELNANYRIVYDDNNCILQYYEMREKKDKNKNPLGFVFEYTNDAYYPNLKSALNGFLTKCTWGLETAKEVLDELNKIELIINKIK